jgi:hypothetical protein
MLELKSLQLDVQTLQQNCELDKKEFQDFAATVNKNFVSIQQNFNTMQANFEKLLAATKGATEPPLAGSASAPPGVALTPDHGSVTQQV